MAAADVGVVDDAAGGEGGSRLGEQRFLVGGRQVVEDVEEEDGLRRGQLGRALTEAFADEISGTVSNGTTGKAAAGVIPLARAKTVSS